MGGMYMQAHRVVVGKGEGAEVATQASGLRGLGWGHPVVGRPLGPGEPPRLAQRADPWF